MAKRPAPKPVVEVPVAPPPPYPGYQQYPMWLRKRNAAGGVVEQILVQSQAEHDAAGDGWE